MVILGIPWIRLFIALILLQGCTLDYEKMATERADYAKDKPADIVIVAIQEPEKKRYIQGVELAVQEINEQPGKLLGRSLKLLIESGGNDFEEILPTLHRIAANPQVTAVFGHRSSKVAVPASVIYEKSHIIFLPSFSTVKGLTNHNFRFVFRMVPNDLVMAEQLASIAQILGYQKMVSLYDVSDYSRDFAFLFEDAALNRNIDFVFRSSFSAKEEDYRALITRFQNENFDAIFLSTGTDSGARMARQLREMRLTLPILSGDGLKPILFDKAAGLSGDNTVIPTVYDPNNKTAINQRFRARYKKRYGTEADFNAAQGYDSVMLLAAAIERAQSTIPSTLSSTLRFMPYWSGVTGLHAFNDQGEILGKHYFWQVLKSGNWHIIPGIQIPNSLEKFEHDQRVAKPDKAITAYRQQFSRRLHPIDFKKNQLDLSHEVLQFGRLGWVYDDSESKIIQAEQRWLQTVAEQKGFILKSCSISFSSLSLVEAEKGLIQCYGKLAPQVDAIYLSLSANMEQLPMKRLNHALQGYQIPILAFQTEGKLLDMGITIQLGRANVQLDTPESMAIYSGLLTKIKAFELVAKLADMPIITADLKLLSDYGYLDSKDLLTLAPHPSEE